MTMMKTMEALATDHKGHETVCVPFHSHAACGHAWSEHGERPDGRTVCPTYGTKRS